MEDDVVEVWVGLGEAFWASLRDAAIAAANMGSSSSSFPCGYRSMRTLTHLTG